MIKRALLLIPMSLFPCSLAVAEDWPQWRGPDRTGVSKETGLLASWPAGGPKLLWTFRGAGEGYSSVAIVGGRLYSMGIEGDKDCIFAVDLTTQKKLWSTPVGPCYRGSYADGPRSTPAVDGDFVYAISGHGNLACVEKNSGKKVWSQGFKTDLKGESEQYGFVVATPGGEQGPIAAFDKKTGVLKWRTTALKNAGPNNSSMIAVTLGGVRQYVQNLTYDGSKPTGKPMVVGVRAADGKLLWEFLAPGGGIVGAICTPICRDDCIFISRSGGSKLVRILPDGNQFKTEEIYVNAELGNYFGGIVLVDSCLYGDTEKAGWMCQDFKTGKKFWSEFKKLGRDSFRSGGVVFADGNLYCFENTGKVRLIKATSQGFKQQGYFRSPRAKDRSHTWAHPVVSNGKLYLRDQDVIFCYDIRSPSGGLHSSLLP
jgi:outer membrane protein assembly factor BamB